MIITFSSGLLIQSVFDENSYTIIKLNFKWIRTNSGIQVWENFIFKDSSCSDLILNYQNF